MSRKGRHLSLPFILAGTAFVMLAFPLLAMAQQNPRATGGGTFEEEDSISTFSFSALRHKDGGVTGNLVYHYRAGDIFIKLDINCLNFIGNKAVMSGVVTGVKGDALPPVLFEGAGGIFQVEDNGEGGYAPPDRVSNLRLLPVGSSVNCNNFNPRLFFPLSGNIQVRP